MAAAAFSANMIQVDFESVMQMKEAQIVQVFQALQDAGLGSFLGDALTVCEPEVKQYVKNARIEGNSVISKVNGVVLYVLINKMFKLIVV